MELVLAVLAASLLGSVHCAGMCGGFVCFYSGLGSGEGPVLRGHVAYHGGRLASYATLGLLGGLAGARLDDAGHLLGVQRGAAVVAGALMVAWGLTRLAGAAGWRGARVAAPLALQRRLGAVVRALAHKPLAARAAALGAVTALLPCGWLWAFVVTAAGTGRPASGAAVMATFWLGTLPMLTALGLVVQRAAGPLRRRLPVVSGAMMVALGFLALAGHLDVGPFASAPRGAHAAHATHLATPHDGR